MSFWVMIKKSIKSITCVISVGKLRPLPQCVPGFARGLILALAALLSASLATSLPAVESGAPAVELVSVCFNYDCARHEVLRFSQRQLDSLRAPFAIASDAASERQAISAAVALFYASAARRTPIWRDRGENWNDDEVHDGRMDCIDHSLNTTAFLSLMERQGWLRFHQLAPRLRRTLAFIQDHWAARIIERGSRDSYAVDSWFYEPGVPAMVYPVEVWMAGAAPPRLPSRHAAERSRYAE